MPIWWGYAACLIGAISFVLVCLYTVGQSVADLHRGGGQEHQGQLAG
jgi:hypothetical protein